MYSLRLTCRAAELDHISGELWQAGTCGIQEIENGDSVVLFAHFESNNPRAALLEYFACYAPKWNREEQADWVRKTRDAWPTREIGHKIFLAPPWNLERTPSGRKRIIHNPGLACGTGEHPCSQLALLALEKYVHEGSIVVDIGTGSGILAIAAVRLGAAFAVALDIDEAALGAAKENFELNEVRSSLVAGSADCIMDHCADLVVANINATVLLSIIDDLFRITRRGGRLILTGFPESETGVFISSFPGAEVFAQDEWRCVAIRTSGV